MKKLIVALLVLMMLLLTSCDEAWEDKPKEQTDNEPEMHLVIMPGPDGNMHPVPIWY